MQFLKFRLGEKTDPTAKKLTFWVALSALVAETPFIFYASMFLRFGDLTGNVCHNTLDKLISFMISILNPSALIGLIGLFLLYQLIIFLPTWLVVRLTHTKEWSVWLVNQPMILLFIFLLVRC